MVEKIHATLCSAVPNIHRVTMGSVKLLPLNKFKGFLIGIYTIVSNRTTSAAQWVILFFVDNLRGKSKPG